MGRTNAAKVEAVADAGTVTVGVKTLRTALREMLSVVEKRNTVPLLACVQIRTGPSTMTMIATDLDIELRQQIDLARPGENATMTFCVDAHTLSGVMGKLPQDGEAVFAHAAGKLTVRAGRSRFDLNTLPADDFPELLRGDWDAQYAMDKANLIALIDATGFAMSTEETRYYLNGIYLHVTDDRLFGAATDGHRLARFDCDVPDGAEVAPGVIVSRKTVAVLDKLLDAHEGGTVDIAVSTGKMHVAIGTVDLVAKLIDGTFPDYTRVIPAGHSKALWIDPAALAEAVDRVATISSDKTRIVRFCLSRDLLTLKVASPENGQAEEDVPCKWDADEMTLGLNASYVRDICRRLTGGNAQIMIGEPDAPTLWRDDENARRLYVLMPARV